MVERAEEAARNGKDGRAAHVDAGQDNEGCLEAHGEMNASAAPSRLVTSLAWIRARQARNHVFSPDLFSDPAWDMLLDLYVNLCRDQRVSITDLCIASAAPMTTGLRWISILENRGLIARQADSSDRRRWNVSLTTAGVEKMEAALDAAMQGDRQLGLGRLGIVE